MVVVETPIFTRRIRHLLRDDEYRRLQLFLVRRPELGRLMPAGGGLRKLRWALPGRGKRGGSRIIYYWDQSSDRIYMIFAYDKAHRKDLTRDQLARLAQVAREELE